MDGVRDVDGRGVANGLAALQGVQQGQFARVGLKQVGERQQHLLAPGRAHPGPRAALERPPGRGHGPVHVRGVAGGDPGQRLAGGGVLADEGQSALGLLELAVDEGFSAELEPERRGFDGLVFHR